VNSASTLTGRRALVTGGSSGIGHAIAARLVAAGAQVAIAARDAAKLDVAARETGARPLTSDLSTPQAAAQLAAQATTLLGGLDILVLSSGVYTSGAITELPETAFADLLGPNLIGPAALARCLAQTLAGAKGDVVFVNSTVTRAQNIAGRTYFAAGQHAMKAFSDGLRDELNEVGVRVTSLFPGTTATPRQQRLHEQAGREYRPQLLLQAEDVAAAALAALSLPHTAEITDLYIRPRHKT
jgi:NADP-dependent 3-hydroxy acid dehydrogenase YdfG